MPVDEFGGLEVTTDDFGGVEVETDEFGGIAVDKDTISNQPFVAAIPRQPIPPERLTTYGGPPLKVDFDTQFRGPSQTISDALSEAYGIGTGDPSESLLAIKPKGVPSGEEITKATGIPKALTIPASAIGRAGAGLGQFLTSPTGGVQVGTAAVPGVGLIQRAKWLWDMASGAGETVGKLSVDVEKALKDPSAVTSEDLQSMADETANTALMLYGAGKLSSHEFGNLTGIRAPLGRMIESDKVRYAKDLAEQLKKSEPIVPKSVPTPERQLGIRIPEGVFAQPGIQALADAALRERMQIIQIPGQEGAALSNLRRAIEPPQISLTTSSLAERLQGGGQAPYGKVSFMRGAEAPLPERTQAAIAAERMSAPFEGKLPSEPTVLAPEKVEGAPIEKPVITEPPKPEIAVMETPLDVKPIEQPTPKPTETPVEAAGKGEGNTRAEVEQRFLDKFPDPLNTAEMNMTTSKEIRGHQKKVLKAMYSDYNATRHDAFVDRYNYQLGEARRIVYERNRGIQAHEQPAQPITQGTTVPTLESLTAKLESGQSLTAAEKKQYLKLRDEATGAQPEAPTKGIVAGRDIEKWADDVLRGGATHAGPDVLAAYMVKGVALIERGIINFAEWSARMIAEHGDKVKPHLRELFAVAQETVKRVPIAETGTLKSAREIVEQRIRTMTEGEEVKMRKSAARATESPAIPEPVQERISTAPESLYRVQPNELVEQAVKSMSDAELLSVPVDSNLFVASRLEAANRLFTAGDMEKGYQVFVELEKQGTSFGQNINQFKRLPGTLPEHTAFLINQKLKNAGKDPLTKQQEKTAIDLTKASKQADAELDAATQAWRKNPTDENASEAQDALLKSNNAAIALQRFIGAFEPRGTASVLKSILQGNLLTPISEVANLFGNMSFLPFRAMDRTVASGLDIIDNAITGRQREVSVSPIGGTAAALSGVKHGLSKVPEILFRGSGDTIKGEKHSGLHPVKAWINQFSKNPEMPTVGGKLTLKDRINLALEGTFGVPAEMMLRGLGAGDQPFKEAARARVISEQLRLKNVPRNQWGFARQFPELFFDRATMEQIKGDTLEAVFQRNSKTIGHMMNWIRGKGDVFDFALATVAPYKLTPWNLVGEILSYNPVVAFSKAALEAKRGNTRLSKLNAGKFFVGSMLTTAGWWLYQNGLLAPSLDERSESQKARVLSEQVLPPNHINISGLQRKLSGGDATYRAGDRTVDIFRAGGLAGSIFYMTANIGRDFETQPETQAVEHLGAIIRESTLEQARFGLNQSFLSGVEGLLTAVKDGNTDNYVRQYMNTVLSIPMPNSLATLSRATREYQPDFRAEGFGKQVENTIRNKLGFAGLDDYLPLRRGLWGEPLPQTPKGANELFYQFFDITKSRQVTDDPVPIELYRLWRKTADTRAIPSLPEKTLTVGGVTYALNPEQRSRYAELVGKYRRQMVDAIVINPAFHKLNDDHKLDMLDGLYRSGLNTGKALFWNESKDTLQPKAKRSGFQ